MSTQVIHTNPITDERWRRLVELYTGDVFHAPAWLAVLADTYDMPVHSVILVDDADQPQAGMAYCKIEDVRGARLNSIPFSDFCDPLIRDRTDWRQLSGALLDEQLPLSMRCLHQEIPCEDPRLTTKNWAYWHSTDLTRPESEIWQNLHSSARRAIRKAERAGVTVTAAQDESDLRAFYELHLRVRKYKYGLLAQPYLFFRKIWEYLIEKGRGTLLLARHDGEIVAGVLFLEWQHKLYYKFNASDAQYRGCRPNDIIIWHGIQHGIAKGHFYLDYGISDWDQEGLVRYKQKYADTEKKVSFLHHQPSSVAQKTARINHLFPTLTQLFTDSSVPDPITESAGDALYRYFA